MGLRWCDVDLDMATLHVVQALYKHCGVCKIVQPKSAHGQRSTAMSPALAILLRQYRMRKEADRILVGDPLKETNFVCAYLDGSPLDPGTVTHTFTEVLNKMGLPPYYPNAESRSPS